MTEKMASHIHTSVRKGSSLVVNSMEGSKVYVHVREGSVLVVVGPDGSRVEMNELDLTSPVRLSEERS